jgi:hypothetical protein
LANGTKLNIDEDDKLNAGEIAGIAIGCIVALLLTFFVAFLVCKCQYESKAQSRSAVELTGTPSGGLAGDKI